MTRAYTDNTDAAEPPGGKRHNPSLARENLVPPEQGFGKTARTKIARKNRKKKSASSEPGVSSHVK